ncbi:MAG: hypothetical protein JW860_11935 [Sedimentisphaerales bacterium]|nr:hypothetical protein [Sedimentisphaerales bacterium]
MKYLVYCTMICFVFVLMNCGCENKELLQCQEENQMIQKEQAKNEEALTLLMDKFKLSTDEISSLNEKIEVLQKKHQQELEKSAIAMKETLKKNKSLQENLNVSKKEITELNQKLKSTQDNLDGISKTMEKMNEKNKELQQKVNDLESTIKEHSSTPKPE